MQNITLADYFLLPFYLIAIYFVAFWVRHKYYPVGHAWRPYFIPALTVKIAGAIFIGLIYEYYFAGGGDTLHFFFHSKLINSSLDNSFSTWLRLITHTADESNISDAFYLSQMYWYEDESAYTVSCIGAFIGMFCFSKYLLICTLLSVISFTGGWSLFRAFAIQYPHLTKQIAIATLFIPSTIMWGSALFKDTICMCAIGWLTYCFYMLFEKRNLRVRYFVILSACVFFTAQIKMYILISFLPVLIFKTLLIFKNSFEKKAVRAAILIFILITYSVAFMYAYKKTQTSKIFTKYSVENIATTVKITGRYLLNQSEKTEGSGYSLGDFDPTLNGIFTKFIPAVNVSLFRPYLWEARKPLIMLAALESLFLLLFTLFVFATNNPFKLVKRFYNDPNILFCLIFALLFAFFTGISSYNFGTLSRYKIPCMPFYVIFLVLLSRKDEKKNVIHEIRNPSI